ncbi:MAG: type II toxin-antitoxin system VapC family toxin [Candidatus Eremiobacterota bacterium]
MLQSIVNEDMEGVTDALVLQELLYSLKKTVGLKKSLEVFDSISCIISEVLNITAEDVFMSRELAEKYPDAGGRDLLHSAVMINNGINTLYTLDNSFSVFTELSSVNPLILFEKGGRGK